MYDSINQLAESKLIILYILDKLNLPISKNQITEVVLENNLMNYFLFQQYITELIDSNFVDYSDKEDKKILSITEFGRKVLSMFLMRIPEDVISRIDVYIKDKIDSIKRN
jgi:hypothetical protein